MVIVPKEFELVEYLRLQERGRGVVGDSCCIGGDKKKHEIPRFLHPNHTLNKITLNKILQSQTTTTHLLAR